MYLRAVIDVIQRKMGCCGWRY